MTKWEYRTARATYDATDGWGVTWSDLPRESVTAALNRMGGLGWELVSTQHLVEGAGGDLLTRHPPGYVLFFKRPKGP
jgi:hypothetical protein